MDITKEDLLVLQQELINRHNAAIEQIQDDFRAHADLLRLDYQSAIRTSNAEYEKYCNRVKDHNEVLDAKADAREAEWERRHAETLAHNGKTQRLIAAATLYAANPGWTMDHVNTELKRLELALEK